MDQIKDSTADQHRRRITQHTKIRCFLGCFGGGTAASEDEKPQTKFKSINQYRWFSCLKLRSKKTPKRTVPVESDEKKVNHEKGRCVLGRSKSKKMISAYDEVPAKGDEEILNQTAVAGDVLHGKANKTRSGKGIFLRNSKSMNNIEEIQPMKENLRSKQGEGGSLRKSKSAKTTTSIITHINKPVTGSRQVCLAEQPEITESGDYGVVDGVKKADERNKGSIDRVVGISIIVMVLLIMAVWGKLCAILCSSAWLYFYPLLLMKYNKENGTPPHVAQTNESKSLQLLVHANSQCQQNNKLVFQGFLQRDHQII